MSVVINKSKPIIDTILQDIGYELVDIEYKNLYSQMNLIIYIDKEGGGITHDDCEKVTHALDMPLEELDPTNGQPYNLSVSSPGLDRQFKYQKEYEKNYGKEVEIKLYAPLKGGKKEYEGVLINRTEELITIKPLGQDEHIDIEHSKVAFVRLLIKFEDY